MSNMPVHPSTRPVPAFPQHPEFLVDPPEFLDQPHVPPTHRQWFLPLIYRALRGWLFPYVRSRMLSGDFHPIIAYLFTEYKCNLDCHYCWAYDNRVKGRTEEVARRSIDWLRDKGAGVRGLTGGERDPHFEPQKLREMKKFCELNCFSTLNHVLARCYDDARVIRYFINQAKRGFEE